MADSVLLVCDVADQQWRYLICLHAVKHIRSTPIPYGGLLHWLLHYSSLLSVRIDSLDTLYFITRNAQGHILGVVAAVQFATEIADDPWSADEDPLPLVGRLVPPGIPHRIICPHVWLDGAFTADDLIQAIGDGQIEIHSLHIMSSLFEHTSHQTALKTLASLSQGWRIHVHGHPEDLENAEEYVLGVLKEAVDIFGVECLEEYGAFSGDLETVLDLWHEYPEALRQIPIVETTVDMPGPVFFLNGEDNGVHRPIPLYRPKVSPSRVWLWKLNLVYNAPGPDSLEWFEKSLIDIVFWVETLARESLEIVEPDTTVQLAFRYRNRETGRCDYHELGPEDPFARSEEAVSLKLAGMFKRLFDMTAENDAAIFDLGMTSEATPTTLAPSEYEYATSDYESQYAEAMGGAESSPIPWSPEADIRAGSADDGQGEIKVEGQHDDKPPVQPGVAAEGRHPIGPPFQFHRAHGPLGKLGAGTLPVETEQKEQESSSEGEFDWDWAMMNHAEKIAAEMGLSFSA